MEASGGLRRNGGLVRCATAFASKLPTTTLCVEAMPQGELVAPRAANNGGRALLPVRIRRTSNKGVRFRGFLAWTPSLSAMQEAIPGGVV